MKHTDFQKTHLPISRKSLGLPEDATMAQVIEGLAGMNRKMEAVELLFATRRNNKLLIEDPLAWTIYINCVIADAATIKSIVDNHQWSNNKLAKGFSMQVYPGEWFTIFEPTATNLLESIM